MGRTEWLAAGLLGLGVLQMGADLLGARSVKGFASATGASPAPRIFSKAGGLETYSTKFFIEWNRADGGVASVQLTPELYSHMRGPYNRRNVYGAALAYGPVLASDPRTAPMLEAVLRRALGGDAPLLRELGIDASDRVGAVRVRLEPLAGTEMGSLPRVLEVPR